MGNKYLEFRLAIFATLLLVLILCISIKLVTREKPELIVEVTNPLDIDRFSESIEIKNSEVPGPPLGKCIKSLSVIDESGKIITTQIINDYLLFQTDIPAMATKKFIIRKSGTKVSTANNNHTTFCRFVPERMDDFAWENDKVAFRMYGPKAGELEKQGDKKGLVSSGVDCWLKRVDYPIINKWYRQALQEGKSYHLDHGEGLDNYHVGKSRGCGGTAIQAEGRMFVSENFTHYEVIANGPIRSVFKLYYGPFFAEEDTVTEIKTITIDLGSNLFRCDENYQSTPSPIDSIGIGLTLYGNEGEVAKDMKTGYIAYWGKLDDASLGTGVIIHAKYHANSYVVKTPVPDESHVWAKTKVVDGKLTYYAGYGWEKAGEFKSLKDWEDYLTTLADRINNPLVIRILNN